MLEVMRISLTVDCLMAFASQARRWGYSWLISPMTCFLSASARSSAMMMLTLVGEASPKMLAFSNEVYITLAPNACALRVIRLILALFPLISMGLPNTRSVSHVLAL